MVTGLLMALSFGCGVQLGVVLVLWAFARRLKADTDALDKTREGGAEPIEPDPRARLWLVK
jgi:hypothetical protein